VGLNGHIPKDGAKVWYVDNSEWPGAASDGQELLTDTHQTGSPGPEGVVRYFDEVVELDASLTSTDGEAFIVVMPVHPTDVDTVDTEVTTTLMALNIEVLPDPDSDGDGVEDALHATHLSQNPSDPFYAGYDLRHIARWPIYHPVIYTLSNFFEPQGEPLALPTGSLLRQWTLAQDGYVSVFKDDYYPVIVHQPHVPQLASIVSAELTVEWCEFLVQPNHLGLYGVLSDRDLYQMNLIGYYDVENNIITGEELKALRIYRNRVGLYWPQLGGVGTDPSVPDTDPREGGWNVFLRFEPDAPNVSSFFSTYPGQFIALVDPRVTQGTLWSY